MLDVLGLVEWEESLLIDGTSVGFSLVDEGTKVSGHGVDMLLGLIV